MATMVAKKYTKISMYDWFNKTKPKFNEKNFIKIYINYPREVLISRINLRVDQMINVALGICFKIS